MEHYSRAHLFEVWAAQINSHLVYGLISNFTPNLIKNMIDRILYIFINHILSKQSNILSNDLSYNGPIPIEIKFADA